MILFDYLVENIDFPRFRRMRDGPTDRRTDGSTDGRTGPLIEDVSKKEEGKTEGACGIGN